MKTKLRYLLQIQAERLSEQFKNKTNTNQGLKEYNAIVFLDKLLNR